MQCVTLLLILVDTGLKELYLPLLVTGIHCTMWWVWKHICQYQWSWDKPYSPGCNHFCPMLQFGFRHVCIGDVHIFKHCHEMTLFLLWIGTYRISCVVQRTSGVKYLSSLVRYDNSSLAAIRHVQSIIPVVRPHPNTRSHSVLFYFEFEGYFPSTSPREAYIWGGDLTEGFLRYWFEGLIHGRAYFQNFTVINWPMLMDSVIWRVHIKL